MNCAHQIAAVLGDQFLEPPLGDPRRAELGQIVAVPLVGHPDPPPAHPDDVIHVLVVALDSDAREVERAFLVEVASERHVGARQAVAAVGLMGLGAGGEQVLAVDEHRHQDRVVGAVSVAEIDVVVQKGVALGEIRVQIAHRLGQELRPEDVYRQSLGGGQQLILAGHQRAGKVSRHVEHRGATRAQQRVGHLTADTIEAVGDYRQQR